jgi:tripartite-type tricarboxylate transporter receptor subunit TctC
MMRLTAARFVLPAAAMLAASLGAASLRAIAQEPLYPDRPLTMVVTFTAGGSSDVLARAVADAMSRGLGRQVVVDNRPGAGGQIGAESVAHAAPDGYTILFGTNGTLGIGPALYRNLRYDPERDLAPIGILHKLPLLLIVNPSVPATNLRELIDYARANPGKLSFASAGIGTVSHLAGELFKEQAGIDILHVPYKGGGSTFPDLLAGRVSMMLETIPTALPLVRNGGMRAIGVTVKERSASVPDIPTLAESGLPDFDVSAWTGLFAPAGTPRAIIERLNKELNVALASADVRQRLATEGAEPLPSTPEEYAADIDREETQWSKVVKESGAKLE